MFLRVFAIINIYEAKLLHPIKSQARQRVVASRKITIPHAPFSLAHPLCAKRRREWLTFC